MTVRQRSSKTPRDTSTDRLPGEDFRQHKARLVAMARDLGAEVGDNWSKEHLIGAISRASKPKRRKKPAVKAPAKASRPWNPLDGANGCPVHGFRCPQECPRYERTRGQLILVRHFTGGKPVPYEHFDFCPDNGNGEPGCQWCEQVKINSERPDRDEQEARYGGPVTDFRDQDNRYFTYRKSADAAVLVSPEDIAARVTYMAGYADWGAEEDKIALRQALALIGEACAQAGGWAVIPEAIDSRHLDVLEDMRIIRTSTDWAKVAVMSSTEYEELKFPGDGPDLPLWHPDYSAEHTAGKHLTLEQQRQALRDLHKQISEDCALPVDPATGERIRLATRAQADFEEAMKRGEIKLSQGYWASLVNLTRPEGTHAVSPKTIGSRLKELEADGSLTRTSDPQRGYNHESRSFRTQAAGYASAAKSVVDTAEAVAKMIAKRERLEARRAEFRAADLARQREAERRARLTGEPAPVPVRQPAGWWLMKAYFQHLDAEEAARLTAESAARFADYRKTLERAAA